MIELGSSIISSTIATVLLYPAQRVKIEMQLNTVKDRKDSRPHSEQKHATHRLQSEQNDNLDTQQEEKSLIYLQQSVFNNQEKQKHAQSAHNPENRLKKFRRCASSLDRVERQKHSSVAHTIGQVYKKHGWTGFYTGLQSLVIGNGLSYGVYFVLYQKCKNYLGFQAGSVIDTIKCSAIAGIGASLATNPFWVLQTKQTQEKGSIVEKGRQLIKNQGFMALWKGISSSLILVSNPIIQFVIYEQLKKLIQMDKGSGMYDLIIFLIGALSKMVSTLCTYPLTVIRTKQHISVDKKKWTKIVRDIVRAQGVRGLFKGIQPKLIQTVLNSALLLMLFQRIRQILLNYFVNKA